MAVLLLLILSYVSSSCYGVLHQNNGSVVVNTTYGSVRGSLQVNGSHPIARFLGIPFAKPPLGQLRFRPPQEPEPWSQVKDAVQYSKRCMQPHQSSQNSSLFGEDCLYLNIFTPLDTPSNKSLPVMVYIHGGGYVVGSGNQYIGTSLAKKGVVVVAFNYRLHMFGFMSMEDDNLPGNYGMLDQIAALKWVQRDISNFGGDPNQVTVFGESAGSSSVSLLIMSPLAKGLFQRAILQSGVALSPWGYHHPGNRISAKMSARAVALYVGCNDLELPDKLITCLQNVDAKELIRKSNQVMNSFGLSLNIGPRVETTYGFLPDLPHVILENDSFNHVDTMHGFCTDESQFFIARSKGILKTQSYAERTEKIMHVWLKQMTDLDQQSIYQLLRNNYGNDQRDRLKSQDDIAFIGPILTELKLHVLNAAEKRHYLYEFNYRPSYSLQAAWVSAVHANDVRFVWGLKPNYGHKRTTAADYQVSHKVQEMWTNFAKSGNPNSNVTSGVTTWNPFTIARPEYLLINTSPEEKTWLNDRAENIYSEFMKRLDGYLA